MSDEELIAWVRNGFGNVAADRIEALVKREAKLSMLLDAAGSVADIQKQRAERLEEALRFYSCKDGCNDCSENERDLIGCGWTARAALRGLEERG